MVEKIIMRRQSRWGYDTKINLRKVGYEDVK
jgi:hypothetical protein